MASRSTSSTRLASAAMFKFSPIHSSSSWRCQLLQDFRPAGPALGVPGQQVERQTLEVLRNTLGQLRRWRWGDLSLFAEDARVEVGELARQCLVEHDPNAVEVSPFALSVAAACACGVNP